jgi:hypothetical protein
MELSFASSLRASASRGSSAALLGRLKLHLERIPIQEKK